MKKAYGLIMVVMLSLLICSNVQAKPSSLLMEEGIYAEETLGDIDKAIRIYNEIVSDMQAAPSYKAEALYHLGICYLKNGEKAEAAKAFDHVLLQYPEQTRLAMDAGLRSSEIKSVIQVSTDLDDSVKYRFGIDKDASIFDKKSIKIEQAKLREYLKKTHPRWPHGQTRKYRIICGRKKSLLTGSGGNAYDYLAITTVNPARIQGKEYWCFETKSISEKDQVFYNRVFANRDSLMPVKSFFKNKIYTTNIVFNEETIELKRDFQGVGNTTQIPIEGPVFAFPEIMYLLELIPKTEGFKTIVSVFVGESSGISDIVIEANGRETVTVPAGTFPCYKIEAFINDSRVLAGTSWISMEKGFIVKANYYLGQTIELLDVYDKPVVIESFEAGALETVSFH